MFEEFEGEPSNPESLPIEQAGEMILGHRLLGHAPDNPVAIRNATRPRCDEATDFLEAVSDALGCLPPDVDESSRFDRIAALERLKAAASAAQSVEARAAEQAVISRHEAEGKYQTNLNRGTGAEVALARRESQYLGPQFVAYSRSMLEHMPHTFAALKRGEINEERAMIIVRETSEFDPMVQEIIDREMAGQPGKLDGVGSKELMARVKRLALAFDNTIEMNKSAEALRKRFISVRMAPGGFMRISGSLPMEQGVALNEALVAAAAKKRSPEDRRTDMQVKADTLVERVTGQTRANGTPLMVNLVMTDRTLMQGDSEPAYLNGYGTIPAGYARYLVAGDPNHSPKESKAQVWIRRLFTAPSSGELVAMESSKRILPKQLKRMIAIRDQFCRTPYCDAPIRHYDHVQQVAMGGRTMAVNGDGRCAWCNYTKETEGWHERVVNGPRHTIEITTPSGQVFRSMAPPLPGTPESPEAHPPLDSC
ncbi:DUF222 domain-containing protein [Paeniglutamicibacter sp. NPDC012692]|uniref:DUF222 domain-containing protein n=1 Tax=Paeniglutamicibacter sp. NPDC012692 TaxID=3364388 RepID=UPI0036B5FFA7